MTKLTDKQIDELVEQSDTIENALLKEAVADLEKQNNEARKLKLIRALQNVQSNTEVAVRNLREARKNEKLAKANVVKYSEAGAEFLKTGDIVAYAKAIAGEGAKEHQINRLVENLGCY